ncbi:putative arabinogalactan protein 16/20/22/41 [Helianthus annuus]|uniref:Arabinogalactan protein 16/20/22/41 n=1 Tax=Helianthus annuus TaxID=4232 RepID=A0A251UME4_HELAN|nr:putative arabinogalactan protein 16/20/22/41 [Helianthus annuus]KAJ0576381.1 putative arabinogalactan protein/22/41 [Helianthus annuus]KAJ0922179.1 putative arabinogalactan protein/22/41 [Helianthus annuus]
MDSMRLSVLPILGFMLVVILQVSKAQTFAPSPTPVPSNDGAAIDQGIAYLLLVLALAITYLVH